MSYLNQLNKNALLGTEKMPLSENSLPEPIRTSLQTIDKNDKEGYFLKAAAMVLAYSKAGQGPTNLVLTAIHPAAEESKNYCSSAAVTVLKKLVQAEDFNPYLFDIFLDKSIHNDWILPHEILVNTLNICPQNLLPKAHAIIGARGKWLVQFNPKWQLKSGDEKSIWEEGKPSERKVFFEQLRKTYPDKALELLLSSWPNESARDRKDFIQLMEWNISKNDESFLDEKANELNVPNAKPITTETLQAINGLRLMIPNSVFGTAIFAKISNYIEKKKGLLSGLGINSSLKLNLPLSEDSFWNGNNMNLHFGFEKLSSVKGISDAQMWFSELVRKMNPQYWLDFFSGDAKKMISFFKDAEGMVVKDLPIFLPSLSEAICISNAISILDYMEQIKKYLNSVCWEKLFAQIDGTNREKYFREYISMSVANIKIMTKDFPGEWTENFAHFILQQLAREVGTQGYYVLSDKDFMHQLAAKIPVSLTNSIEDIGNSIQQEWHKNYWKGNFSENIIAQLDLKKQLNTI